MIPAPNFYCTFCKLRWTKVSKCNVCVCVCVFACLLCVRVCVFASPATYVCLQRRSWGEILSSTFGRKQQPGSLVRYITPVPRTMLARVTAPAVWLGSIIPKDDVRTAKPLTRPTAEQKQQRYRERPGRSTWEHIDLCTDIGHLAAIYVGSTRAPH